MSDSTGQLNKTRLLACILAALTQYGCTSKGQPDPPAGHQVSQIDERSNKNATLPIWDSRIEAKDLNEDEFTDLYERALKSAWPRAIIKRTARLTLEVQLPAPKDTKPVSCTMNLDNAWKSCSPYPGERKKILVSYIIPMEELVRLSSLNAKDFINNVVPLVRSKDTLDVGTEDPKHFAVQPLGADLVLIYAINCPGSISYLEKRSWASTKLSTAQLKERAWKNFRSLLKERKIELTRGDGIAALSCGGDYESSLLLDEKVMEQVTRRLGGRILFAVPTRSLVIFSTTKPENIKKLRELTQKMYKEGDHTISDKIYRYNKGEISFYN